jgi:hypothetical protein
MAERRLGEGVETPLTAALAGETSNIVSSTGEISVIVPEQHKQTIIPRQPSSTLFPRLKMRCNRLVSASHPNGNFKNHLHYCQFQLLKIYFFA